MDNPLNLSGRVAVITGASRGIGSSIARIFAAHGATVVLHGLTMSDPLAKLAAEIASQGGRALTVVGDVAEPATADALVQAAFGLERRLDIWVNNAGQLKEGVIGMMPPAAIAKVVDANLNGVLYGMQAAAKLMRRSDGGSIINMSSIMGRFGQSGIMAYCASKAGVIGASLAASKELAPSNIRVNVIAPGFINTDMTSHMPDEARLQKITTIGLGRAGTPDEVANLALFLASDMSCYVTGQIIGVDGGMIV